MYQSAIPVLRVTSAEQAHQFYGETLGFERLFAYRIDDAQPDPCYQGYSLEGVKFHVSSFPGDGVFGSVVYFVVENLDPIYSRFLEQGIEVLLPPTHNRTGACEKCPSSIPTETNSDSASTETKPDLFPQRDSRLPSCSKSLEIDSDHAHLDEKWEKCYPVEKSEG